VASKKGLKSRAVGFYPSKADFAAQSAFVSDTLEPLVLKAEKGLIELFFMDASHFVMGGFAGRVWSKVRKWIKTPSGRKRYNVLGALNFVTKRMEIVANETYITGTQVIEMLNLLQTQYTDKIIKIVLDRAAYHRCGAVTTHAASLGIELVFLPPYSPNLNLIERVWKLVKSNVLNAAYTETFSGFKQKIDDCIKSFDGALKEKMIALITPKFQLFNKCSIID